MSEPRQSTPSSKLDTFYIEEFAKERTRQGERFDEFYKILFNIELAALSAYILLLRFFVNSISELNFWFLFATIVFWLIALILTIYGFFPKYYKNVMGNVVQREQGQTRSRSGKYSITEYYDTVAIHKRRYVLLALISFCLGLFFVILTLTF
ncbi:MAG: hypothetical protein VSS52_005830 [Thiotrichaceae bacterium]|nr:hypothetical protein [Thiotrichaceae bacterium]